MALRAWDPFTVLARLDSDFDDLVRRTWGQPSQQQPTEGRRRSTPAGYVPATDMVTHGNDVVISLELPGVDVEKDIDIEVREGTLRISGERRETVVGDDARALVREQRYGSFRREFALPEGVDADMVEASYERGLLQVRVRNVTRPAPEPRKIPVVQRDERPAEGQLES